MSLHATPSLRIASLKIDIKLGDAAGKVRDSALCNTFDVTCVTRSEMRMAILIIMR